MNSKKMRCFVLIFSEKLGLEFGVTTLNCHKIAMRYMSLSPETENHLSAEI